MAAQNFWRHLPDSLAWRVKPTTPVHTSEDPRYCDCKRKRAHKYCHPVEDRLPKQNCETVHRYTCHTSHFNTSSHCTACSHLHSHIHLTRHAWLKPRIVCTMKTLHLARHVSCLDTRYTQHLHSVLIFLTFLSYPAVTSVTHCEDPLPPQERGSSPERPPPTGCEPNRIVDNQIVDDQKNMSFTEIEDQAFLPSTQDSAESIATPQEADIDE